MKEHLSFLQKNKEFCMSLNDTVFCVEIVGENPSTRKVDLIQ